MSLNVHWRSASDTSTIGLVIRKGQKTCIKRAPMPTHLALANTNAPYLARQHSPTTLPFTQDRKQPRDPALPKIHTTAVHGRVDVLVQLVTRVARLSAIISGTRAAEFTANSRCIMCRVFTLRTASSC